jgi:hypothetical protein
MADRFDILTARTVGDKTYWTKIGVAFPMKDREGMRLVFEALPIPAMREGKLECTAVLMPPKPRDGQAPRGDADGDAIPF